jgi:hypothetical protein
MASRLFDGGRTTDGLAYSLIHCKSPARRPTHSGPEGHQSCRGARICGHRRRTPHADVPVRHSREGTALSTRPKVMSFRTLVSETNAIGSAFFADATGTGVRLVRQSASPGIFHATGPQKSHGGIGSAILSDEKRNRRTITPRKATEAPHSSAIRTDNPSPNPA